MTAPTTTDPPPPATAGPTLTAWRNAIFTVFGLTGIGFATWVARIPAVRDQLHLSTPGVAALVFSLAGGSIIGLVVAPHLLARLGGRGALRCTLGGFTLGLLLAGIGTGLVQASWAAMLGLALFGMSYGATDVIMNVEAAEVETRVGRTLMPLMHAFFSIGTIVGAAIAAAAAAAHIPVVIHFSLTCIALGAGTLAASRAVPNRRIPPDPTSATSWRHRVDDSLSVWKDPRLLLLGLVMLGMGFTEGSANDWLTLAAVDGYGFTNTSAAVVYGVFVAAMTIGRLVGGPVLDRLGRVRVLLALVVLAVLGLLLLILRPATWVAYPAAALWGLGASLGFPIGFSAAAEHPTHAAQRVSAVAVFGYAAFLAGPPLIGLLGQRYGLLNSFYLVLALLVIAALALPAARARPAHGQIPIGDPEEVRP